jgi:hypothetical protein
MTQQIINIGAAPNDGTGDQLRSSFDKCNLNFTELYAGVAKGVSIGPAIEYQFNNTTTEPPASGQIRFNQATQASTTKLWASHTTSSGINIKQFLSAATTGAKLILQDENDNTNYIKCDVTGTPIDKTTYWEFAVAVTASGGNLPNAAILAAVTAATGGGGTATPTPPQGRLTLQTGTPVMTTSQAAQTTIRYSPHVGNRICIYDGTDMTMVAFAELAVATTDTTQNATAIGASKCNDWFVWNRSGSLVLSHGPDWTNDTTRSAGTALVMVNGIWLNNATIGNGTTTGPAAQRGTYVGTTRSNASSQLDWIYGVAGVPPTAGALHVWNAYNRVRVTSFNGENTTNWTYGSSTVRQMNGDTTYLHSFVAGLSEDAVLALSNQILLRAAGDPPFISIGYDTSSAFSGSIGEISIAGLVAVSATFTTIPAIGRHFVAAVESSGPTTGFPTFWGNFGSGNASVLTLDFRM